MRRPRARAEHGPHATRDCDSGVERAFVKTSDENKDENSTHNDIQKTVDRRRALKRATAGIIVGLHRAPE